MDDLVLESPLLKLPLEALKTSFKAQQKLVERDSAWLAQQASQPCTTQSIEKMIARLEQLKQKLSGLQKDDKRHLKQSRDRLTHLELQGDNLATGRLDRLVADYMLRRSCTESGSQYAARRRVSNLVDAEVFTQVAEVATALRAGKTATCLAWCNDHKTSLRKRASPLEFQLRRQEFVELCRLGTYVQAIDYARKNLGPHRAMHGKEIDTVCALLCHRPQTTLEPYRTLYAKEQWQNLADLFIKTHHELYNIPVHAPLEIALSAGMAALKTPACADTWAHHKTHPTTRLQNWIGDERKGRGDHKVATRYVCPICSPELLELSDTVPVAKVARSHLVDALDPEELLEGENIPVVLPSGRLYGLVSLRAYCKRHDIPEGKIMDPSTGEIFDATTVRKAFVL